LQATVESQLTVRLYSEVPSRTPHENRWPRSRAFHSYQLFMPARAMSLKIPLILRRFMA